MNAGGAGASYGTGSGAVATTSSCAASQEASPDSAADGCGSGKYDGSGGTYGVYVGSSGVMCGSPTIAGSAVLGAGHPPAATPGRPCAEAISSAGDDLIVSSAGSLARGSNW